MHLIGSTVELSHLRYFVHVATARSFAAGARASFVTPPALSKAVKALENELGVRLLERTTRQVRLTRAGEVVLERSHRVLDEADSIARDLLAAAGEVRGELRIAGMEVFSIALLPAALSLLVADHPRVTPLVYEMGPDDQVHGLERGLLDVGFSIGGRDTDSVRRQVIGVSPACVVVGRGHPLYRGGRARRLREHGWVVPRLYGRPWLPALDQYPDDAHPRRVAATIELLQTGIALACSGRYVGCFPEVSIRREIADGRLKRLSGAPKVPAFELAAFTRRWAAPSPAVEALVTQVCAVLKRVRRR
jgi:DNA-binding transcriptional LysR family regulator